MSVSISEFRKQPIDWTIKYKLSLVWRDRAAPPIIEVTGTINDIRTTFHHLIPETKQNVIMVKMNVWDKYLDDKIAEFNLYMTPDYKEIYTGGDIQDFVTKEKKRTNVLFNIYNVTLGDESREKIPVYVPEDCCGYYFCSGEKIELFIESAEAAADAMRAMKRAGDDAPEPAL